MIEYQFEQLERLSCADMARSLGDWLIDCRAVNTAFDGGRIIRTGWDSINGFPVTPVITPDFISNWPVSHEAYCDEWWVFVGEIPRDFEVQDFCSYIGMPISDYKELDFDGGCRLDSYLERFQPRVVFGNNELGYVISRSAPP